MSSSKSQTESIVTALAEFVMVTPQILFGGVKRNPVAGRGASGTKLLECPKYESDVCVEHSVVGDDKGNTCGSGVTTVGEGRGGNCCA